MRRIDSHHHLWRYTSDEFGWIDDDADVLRRDFLLPEFITALREARVDGAVAVQARQTVEETSFLLDLAEANPQICGVVGWLPLADPAFERVLEEFSSRPLLKGLRHVVQAEPGGFLDREDFNRGVRSLAGTGLVYDILIHAAQLREATGFVDRHPRQQFVLDHAAKPRIRAGEMEPWRSDLRELARRPNVACKLSGLVTEANPRSWTAAGLAPYAEVALECFGAGRLMIGSDWPVVTVGCGYAEWWGVVEEWVDGLSAVEQGQILGGNAERVYRLQIGCNITGSEKAKTNCQNLYRLLSSGPGEVLGL